MLNQPDLRDTHRAANSGKSTPFSSTHRTVSTDQVRPQTGPGKFLRIKVTQIMFSDHNGMNSEINKRRIFGQFINGKLDKTLKTYRSKTDKIRKY